MQSLTDNDANDIVLTANTGDITVGVVNAGVANGDVTITATTGSILDDANDATTDITGDVVTLTAANGVGEVAGNGTLDTRANSLDVSVTGNGVIRIDELDAVTLTDIDTANGSITITAGGAINAVDVQSLTDNDANDIVLTANTGDITIGVVNAGVANGDVTITATTGSILDDTNDATTDITGDVVTLTAATGVGEVAGNGTLDTRANSLDVSVTGDGVIRIDELDAVTLTDIDTANGSITITAGGAINAVDVVSTTDNDANDIVLTANTGDITIGVVNAGVANGDVTITATTGSILDDTNDATTDITGDVVTLTAAGGVGQVAGNGTLDTRANSLDVSVTGNGVIRIDELDAVTLSDIDTANGSITITAGGAINAVDVVSTTDNDANDIVLTANTGDITIGVVNAGVANGDVTITATTGSIVDDANDATTDITGDVVTLTAAGGVGQVAGNGTLDTRANSLDVSVTGDGVIRIDELDAVTLSDIDTANGSITITSGGAINAVDVQSLTDNDANDIVLTANTGDITVGW